MIGTLAELDLLGLWSKHFVLREWAALAVVKPRRVAKRCDCRLRWTFGAKTWNSLRL